MASTSILASASDEKKWITKISTIIENEVKLKIDIPVSIFRIPKSISVFKPKAYEPQLIGLGPYHHFQPELYEMERYKLASASRVQKEFKGLEFKELVGHLIKLEDDIRACYHKYLDIGGDTLAWLMAIDGLFLLEFLTKLNHQMDGKSSTTSTTAQLVDSSGKKLNNDGILGDILMLENQIPIFLLSKILSIQCSLPEISNIYLPTILYDFCKSLSPLRLENELKLPQVCDYAHLLDLLYHMIVPKIEGTQDQCFTQGEEDASSFFIDIPKLDSSESKLVFTKLYSMVQKLDGGFVSKLTNPIRKMIDTGKNIVKKIPGAGMIFAWMGKKTQLKAEESKMPNVEEIMIPSVSYLNDAGVVFSPSSGGISTVTFDRKTKTFYLPVLALDVNSEIVMRNLVAYEASAMSDALVFTRYIDLMSGIINTTKDSKFLREKKIILNSLKSDDDIAELFNGMSRSVRLTHVPFIDKAIEDVNQYFYNTPRVRIYMRIIAYVQGSWQVLTILAVILLMLLNGLQSFCSFYSCREVFNLEVFNTTSAAK